MAYTLKGNLMKMGGKKEKGRANWAQDEGVLSFLPACAHPGV